jgi:hypothetical protein
VITAHEASRERWLKGQPDLLTTSTNRNLIQPTRDNKIRRSSNIRETVENVTKRTQKRHKKMSEGGNTVSSPKSKGKQKEVPNGEEGRAPIMKDMQRHHSSDSSFAKPDRSQLVDLVVEDTDAEETERVRARKEGSAAWNETEPKRYV